DPVPAAPAARTQGRTGGAQGGVSRHRGPRLPVVGEDGPVGEIPEQVARELYVVPPRRFVERRDAAAARARAAGDPQLARAIARLRRPTVAAWLVNLLAHPPPDLVAGPADLAAGLQARRRTR